MVKDKCGVCGGTTFAEGVSCSVSGPTCVDVDAPAEIGAFQARFIKNARTLYERLLEESRRATANRCRINVSKEVREGRKEYNRLIEESRKIFHAGRIRVCGDDCATVAYADHTKAILPTFKSLSRRAVTMATSVATCIGPNRRTPNPKRLPNSATQTAQGVRTGLNQLIEDCKQVGKICKK
jgi:hypothetical protein